MQHKTKLEIWQSKKPVFHKKCMFDHRIKLTYLQKFSSGLSLNIFDIVSGAQITLQILPIVDRSVYFPFYMTLEVYPKVAKSFIVKMAVGESEYFSEQPKTWLGRTRTVRPFSPNVRPNSSAELQLK